MTQSIRLLNAVTATNSPPTASTDGQPTNDIKVGGNVPDMALITVRSTAGSATMTVTLKLWGFSLAAADWCPVGTDATAANKGLLNQGNAIPEGPEADTIQHTEPLADPGLFTRLYMEVTAIGGTATAVSCWVEVEEIID